MGENGKPRLYEIRQLAFDMPFVVVPRQTVVDGELVEIGRASEVKIPVRSERDVSMYELSVSLGMDERARRMGLKEVYGFRVFGQGRHIEGDRHTTLEEVRFYGLRK